MLNFCTLFDSFYLSRALVMYESLAHSMQDFHLFIFTFDDLSFGILKKLNLDKVTIVSLKEFEDDELLNVKSTRTKGEYCWTCTSSTILYVLNHYNVESCTYIDADLYFYNSPSVLIGEMNDEESVLITEHRYSQLFKLYEEKRAGKYCVQFVTFKNNENGRRVLQNWRKQCIDWCYARYEEGKFGDQKYLDNWLTEYKGIHVLTHLGGGVAPWNVQQYKLNLKDHTMFLSNANQSDVKLIFFHFQYVKLLENKWVDIGWHYVGKSVIKLLYQPYIEKIMQKEKMLRDKFSDYKTCYSKFSNNGLKEKIKSTFKKLFSYNLINTNKWLIH